MFVCTVGDEQVISTEYIYLVNRKTCSQDKLY